MFKNLIINGQQSSFHWQNKAVNYDPFDAPFVYLLHINTHKEIK
jgi:hypothetical protein